MINQATVVITVFLGILTFVVPKKFFLLPFILAACFVPADQRVIIFDLDFTPLRILVLVGFFRTILQGERLTFKWNHFDKLVLVWAICGAVIYIIQWADMRALVYKCGVLFDVIGLYWLFRINISSWGDIRLAITVFAVCSLGLAVLVGLEWATGKNPFVVLGRVETVVREGRYRCQASFPHAIMLGLFWATLVPLFIGFARKDKSKLLLWSAVGASAFIAAATASSTPILTLLIVPVLLCGYRWREYTACAGWGLFASLVALHIVMQAPVWHLISRIGVVGGSTGWHRFYLIDQAINHLGEWMFLGCRSTAHWGLGLSDVTNQYILEGVRGGFVSLALFFVMIYMALRILLRLSLQHQEHKQRFLTWCLFVTILGHSVSFLGVSYFGQIMMWWYMTLAAVGFLYEDKKRGRRIVIYRTTLPERQKNET
ncbi:MAG TPA: hypothetical protein VMW72_13615 [Sedimentisphaerales bacterium]|nr:hypothetical protein [Sedimentisphaerales bacterium]